MLVGRHQFDILVCLKSWRSFGGIPGRVKGCCELMLPCLCTIVAGSTSLEQKFHQLRG